MVMAKMNGAVSTAAMWADDNVSIQQSRIMLKHLHKSLGFQVSFDVVVLYTLLLPVFQIAPPKFGRCEDYSKLS